MNPMFVPKVIDAYRRLFVLSYAIKISQHYSSVISTDFLTSIGLSKTFELCVSPKFNFKMSSFP